MLALDDFLEWASATPRWCTADTDGDFDFALAEWIDSRWLVDPSPGSRSKCAYALQGLRIRLGLPNGTSLPTSQRCLLGWKKQVPPQPYKPVPEGVLLCMVQSLWREGERAVACALVLCFYGYLRPGDLTNEKKAIRRAHVSLPGMVRGGGDPDRARVQAVASVNGKTGDNQPITFSHPLAIAALRWLLENTEGDRLCPVSYDHLRRMCAWAGDRVGFPFKVTPHMLRKGGAVHAFLSGVPLPEIKFQGRWLSMRTCEYYISSGRALMQQLPIPPGLERRARLLLANPFLALGLGSDFRPRRH